LLHFIFLKKVKIKKMRQVRSLKILLKDMESIVKNPKLLYNGRDFKNFSLRPREVWANWLLCAVYQNIHKDESITFAEDEECDGVLIDKLTGGSRKTEHVSALDVPLRKKGLPQGETRIIDAINLKINKGKEYAEGKILVVFFDGAGKWYRNKIREAINGRHNFCMI